MSLHFFSPAPSTTGLRAGISHRPFVTDGVTGIGARSTSAAQGAYYSSIGGGAAPFGPILNAKSLENGALLKSCVRHIHRTTRKQRPDGQAASTRNTDGSSAFDNFFASGTGGGLFHKDGSTRTGKLYCRSGYHLQIHQDGKVNGTRQENNRFGVLEFLSVAFGLVSIKGKESNRYLCMNKRGRLYGSTRHTGECIFMEKMLENYYNTYTSCRYGRGRHSKKKWYVALNKRGRPKRGNQSRKKHRFTQFLVLHLDAEDFKWARRKFVFPNRDSYFGLDSFAHDWRRRQTPWERVRFGQQQPGSAQRGQESLSSKRTIPMVGGSVNGPLLRNWPKVNEFGIGAAGI